MHCSPIVLFAYNRLGYIKKTIKALKKNHLSKNSVIYIFSDQAKNENDFKNIDLVRKFISTINGFKKINIIYRKKNLGLSTNIIAGINYVFKFHKTAIILEDDIVVSKFFLNYMNKNLQIYEKQKNVISIHGYNYPMDSKYVDKFFFIKGADCWGWATWRNKWRKYFINNSKYLANIIKKKKLIKDFNFGNRYNFFKMLTDNISCNKSWAINWYASAFIKNMLTLYPKKTLVKNIGLVGTNSYQIRSNFNFNSSLDNKFHTFRKIKISEDMDAKIKMGEFLRKMKLNEYKIKISSFFKF